jgi:hypothetical protein
MHAANSQWKGPKRLEDREDRDFSQADCFVFFASIRVHSRLLFAACRAVLSAIVLGTRDDGGRLWVGGTCRAEGSAKADQFAVRVFAVLLVKPNPPKRADAPKTIRVTIKTAPVTICCSSGVTPASPNTF